MLILIHRRVPRIRCVWFKTRGTYFADVNGDGKADAIVVNDDIVTVRISDGTKFLPNASWISEPYYGTRGTYFADVNGDRKADAIVSNDAVTLQDWVDNDQDGIDDREKGFNFLLRFID